MQVSMRLCLRTGLALGLGAVAVAQAFAADIKVGFITSLSGPVSSLGIPYDKGIKAGAAYKSEVAGHKITMISLDDASDPSTAARNARPIRRWISTVRPPCLPRAASRSMRLVVERGSMPYSAVSQPLPSPRRKRGTLRSMLAVQITRVSPNSTSTEPSAWRR